METIIYMVVVRTTVVSILSPSIEARNQHIHFNASLDASLLSIVAPPFAIMSSLMSLTRHLFTPKCDSYSMTREGILFALMSAFHDF